VEGLEDVTYFLVACERIGQELPLFEVFGTIPKAFLTLDKLGSFVAIKRQNKTLMD
jgi:hypothetical protein